MAKKTKLFRHKERKNRTAVSEFFLQLSQKFAEGQMVFRQSPEDLVLTVPHSLLMKVKVSQKHKRVKGARHKLSITLTWDENDIHHEGPLTLG